MNKESISHKKSRPQSGSELKLLNNARYRATKKNLDFDLRIEDINIPKKCPYLDIDFTNMFNKDRTIKSIYLPTIDRIDNNKGYTKDNIEIVSLLANRMKQNATKEQLLSFAKNVLLKFK